MIRINSLPFPRAGSQGWSIVYEESYKIGAFHMFQIFVNGFLAHVKLSSQGIEVQISS